MEMSKDIEDLFEKVVNWFPDLRDKILLEGEKQKAAKREWNNKKRNAKPVVAQEPKV